MEIHKKKEYARRKGGCRRLQFLLFYIATSLMKRTGDNTKFVYIPKREQKAKFVYKELCAIVVK